MEHIDGAFYTRPSLVIFTQRVYLYYINKAKDKEETAAMEMVG